MSSITLEPEEFAVLLALLDASSVYGMDTTLLFPEDEHEQQAIFDQGCLALQKHGYLRLIDGKIQELATPLLFAVAALAAPDRVILTTRYLPDGEQVFGHYLADDLIVEFYMTAEQNYRLLALDSVDTAIARIEAILGLNGSPTTDSMSFSILQETLEKAFTLAQTGELERLAALLVELDVHASAARRLMETLADPQFLADVDLAWMMSGEVIVQQSVALFATGNEVGMVHFDRSGPAVLTVPADAAFGNALRNGLRSLKEIRQPVEQPEGIN